MPPKTRSKRKGLKKAKGGKKKSGNAEFSMLMGKAFQEFMGEFDKFMSRLLSKEGIDDYVRAMRKARTTEERKVVEKTFVEKHRREFAGEIKNFEKHMGTLAKNLRREGEEMNQSVPDVDFGTLEKNFVKIAEIVANNERRFLEEHRGDLESYKKILGDYRVNIAE